MNHTTKRFVADCFACSCFFDPTPVGRKVATTNVLLGIFFACVLLTLTASAQPRVPPVAQQDDSTDSPLLRQRARAHEQQQRRKGGAEKDDPRARLEWQRRESGIPSVEFKQHLLRLRQS